jgi:hypothetical protein
MFVIKISNVESSCHTQECDALEQKARFIESGVLEENIEIVDQSVFTPPPPPVH